MESNARISTDSIFLLVLLSATTTKLDIIAITETSEKDETGFVTNVEIEGYDLFHTPTLSAKGGSAIYVNKNYDSLERYDLNIKDIEYEITWIEIKNKKVRILFVVMCIGIHIITVMIFLNILKHVWLL